MSNEIKDLNNYHYTSSYNHYNINNQNMMNLPYVSGPSTYNANMISSSQLGFDLPSKNLSPQGAFDLGFELSPSSSDFFNPSIDQENGLYNAFNYNSSHKSHEVVGGGCATIKSEVRVSASPSSSEADHHPGEDSGKILKKREAGDGGEDDQRSQKVVKTKKKEEKKKEPRVSFMTKTEVDHLEDGYRWRKYGQKAVKNSPYPRSYYRCTTQKCNVKKRVERSYQDPTVVITTYESQHNHPIPTNRRTAMFSGTTASDYNPSSSPVFSDLIMNTPRSFSNDDLFRVPYASVNVNPTYHQQQQQGFHQQESEFDLLKEMFPSVFFKQEH
ncbi:PREDICTED: probable WRKY transcription factor 8 isoform X3 [Camelina sativa]|uniref:Probable WRKY transcription factor 8 isoform X1 n=1 Tax=Camelina sativa TaxID=90675 RepID=A0ABM1RE21_CAMSA|nr:PREDICTED: probable WRKY transcription factor 8 isoform X1 [Camelina sativa]XP_019097259.1 PREDICTED: probable WRKY transcription factor 8 isoform X2 [Camelina sativa]XP_019097260.1 PREDICTED: probable WRKY transcription factor 8 isoform X3 [Camelina sativa]